MKINKILKNWTKLLAFLAILWGGSAYSQIQYGGETLDRYTSCDVAIGQLAITYPNIFGTAPNSSISITFPTSLSVGTFNVTSVTEDDVPISINTLVSSVNIDAANNKVTFVINPSYQDTGASLKINYSIKNIGLTAGNNTTVVTNNGTVSSTNIYTSTAPDASSSCLTATNDVYGTVLPGTTTTTSIYANDLSIYGTWTNPVTGAVTNYRPNGTYGPGDAASQTPINVTTTITDDGGLTGVTLNQNGTVNIPANALPGSYTLTYYMCSSEDNTIQCKTAYITLTIPGVDAVDDPNFATFNAGTGGTSTASVLANDKYTDGTTPTSANVTVSAYNANTAWPAGITIGADGKINVSSTVAAGTYNLEYQICNKNNSEDCDVATVTVQVNGLTANPDNGSATQGVASTPVANVVANDQYNGATPVIGTANGEVTISPSGTWPAGFTLDTSTGAVSVAATVAAGTYTMDYQECVNGANPALCKTATVTIVVSASVCYNPVTNTAAGTPVNHGITLLKRAGADNGGWPMNRSSAHTALESNTKGFVITRVPTSGLSAITNPVEGMMVYDTTAKCLKIYVVDNTTPANTGWKCFSTPACP